MCGIFGYIGDKQIEKELIKNLKKLEYRGYDSAGIAVLKDNEFVIQKESGSIVNLENALRLTGGSVGISHTRWATHGIPSKENAHPHKSYDNNWVIVHNGIIENYKQLKDKLLSQNIQFESQTDSEVIAHMLSANSKNNIENLIDVCTTLQGSFALIVANKNKPKTLYLAKRKSPLYVGVKDGEVYIASDLICLNKNVDNYYTLDDDEFCEVSNYNITFYDKNKNIITKNNCTLENMELSDGLGDFSHFMQKEILEVPSVINRIIDVYKTSNILDKIEIEKYNKVILVGCGTAYHASLMGARYIEKFARIDSRAYVASEFRYSDPIIDDKTLAIFVSQSGETADTISALNLAKSKGAKIISLTNVLYNTIARLSDIVLPVCAGSEIAVASTKAYSAMITTLYILSKNFQKRKFGLNCDYFANIERLSNELNLEHLNIIKYLSEEIKLCEKVFFIGRDLDYVTAIESSLKLKEITYINSSAYPSGELKHGFLALVDDDSKIIVIATQKDLLDKTLNNAFEAMARGGEVIAFSQYDLSAHCGEKFKQITLPIFDEEIMPIATISYFQLLSYLVSISKDINPDKPRNLAKSVTVE